MAATPNPITQLNFNCTHAGRYHAFGATHSYVVQREGRQWRLSVYRSADLGAAITSDMHDTMNDALATANAYEALGDDFKAYDHGGRSRHTVAVELAYDNPGAWKPVSQRARYAALRAELGQYSLIELREINETISVAGHPRGSDALYVEALHVCMNRAMPRRIRFH